MDSLEEWDAAVKRLRAELWAQRRVIIAFLAGWGSYAIVVAVIWLIAPERFC